MNNLLSTLAAISPIDGRYHQQTKVLSTYFSEFALIKYRLKIEIEYFIFLSKIKISPKFSGLQIKLLRNIYLEFDIQEATKIKNIEILTKHDVKAIEYYLRNELKNKSFSKFLEWIGQFEELFNSFNR